MLLSTRYKTHRDGKYANVVLSIYRVRKIQMCVMDNDDRSYYPKLQSAFTKSGVELSL